MPYAALLAVAHPSVSSRRPPGEPEGPWASHCPLPQIFRGQTPVARPARCGRGPMGPSEPVFGTWLPGHQLGGQAWGSPGLPGARATFAFQTSQSAGEPPGPPPPTPMGCSGRGSCLLPSRPLRIVPGSAAWFHLSQGGSGAPFAPLPMSQTQRRLIPSVA